MFSGSTDREEYAKKELKEPQKAIFYIENLGDSLKYIGLGTSEVIFNQLKEQKQTLGDGEWEKSWIE